MSFSDTLCWTCFSNILLSFIWVFFLSLFSCLDFYEPRQRVGSKNWGEKATRNCCQSGWKWHWEYNTLLNFFLLLLLLLIDEKRVKKLQEKQEKNLFPQFRRVSHIIQAHCYSTAGDDDDDDVVFDCFVVSRARAVRYQKSRPVFFFFFLS